MVRKSLFLLGFLFGICGLVHAQEYVRLMETPGTNFYPIQTAFNAYWEGKSYQKGLGYKQFRRWEAFMEPRVYPTGKFPEPDILWKESKKFLREPDHSPLAKRPSNWMQFMTQDTLSFTPFSAIPGHGRVTCIAISPLDSNRIYIGTPSGGLWMTENGGNSWTPLTDDLPIIGVGDIVIHPQNDQLLYMATGDNDFRSTYSIGVLKSTDGGSSWNPTGLNYAVSQQVNIRKLLMHPQHPDTLWAATASGLMQTLNGGTNWTLIRPGAYRDIAYKTDDLQTLFATTNGGFYKSTDGGFTFFNSGLPENTAINRMELTVSPANPNIVFVIAADASNAGLYALYRSNDAGNSFSTTANTTNILGYFPNGGVGGQAWFDLDIALSPTDSNTVYTAGINIWKSTDGGDSFAPTSDWSTPYTSKYVHGDVHKLEFDRGRLFTACDGGIFKSNDQGANWTDLSANLTISQIWNLCPSPFSDDVVLAGMQDVGTSLYDGNKWTTVTWGDGFDCVFDPTDSLTMYTTAHRGVYFKTTTGPSGFYQYYPSINETAPFSTILQAHPNDPQTLYACHQNVWRSTNGASTWSRISNLGNSFPLQRMEISESNPDYMYVTSNFLAYASSNGGGTWTPISNGIPTNLGMISGLHIHPFDPLQVWVTLSGYSTGSKVFYSTDGGNGWANISGNLPNIPANCILAEGDDVNGQYVGMDVGVYYTNDTLPDWIPFLDGLPNVIVRELKILRGPHKIRAGTYGRGVWDSDLFSDPLSVFVEPPRQGSAAAKLSIYPNPSRDFITLNFAEIAQFTPHTLKIYDGSGKLVREQKLRPSLQKQIRISIQNLSQGTYSCILSDGKNQASGTFLHK